MSNAHIEHYVLGTISNPEQFDSVISSLSNCRYYAYIFHDRDYYKSTDKKVVDGIAKVGHIKPVHLHFVANDRHNLRTWAKALDIPQNMICICHDWRKSNRYLVHFDDPDKALYQKSEVVTNSPLRFESYFHDLNEVNPLDLYQDMELLYSRKLTRKEFIEKYKLTLNTQSFYSQFKIYQEILKHE